MDQPTSPRPDEALSRFAAAARGAVLAVDFDGTLSPIVDDPTQARIHPDAPAALLRVGRLVRTVAVITGRPARQAIALGDLDDVGAALAGAGGDLHVFGHYGNERWAATDRRIVSPRPPHGLARFEAELPGLLRRAGVGEAYVEEKGLGVAVHTRRLPDPADALARISGPVRELAARHDLVVEPGRHVVEVRAPGHDKGDAVRALVAETDPTGFCFAGDDLGDIPAFEALGELRAAGMPTLRVCSGSTEQTALVELSDLVVEGPAGVVVFLERLADLIEGSPDAPDATDATDAAD